MKKVFMVFTLGMLAILLVACGGGLSEEQVYEDTKMALSENVVYDWETVEYSSMEDTQITINDDNTRTTTIITAFFTDTDNGDQYWIDYEVTLYYEDGEWQYRQWNAIEEGVIN